VSTNRPRRAIGVAVQRRRRAVRGTAGSRQLAGVYCGIVMLELPGIAS